MRAAKAAGLIEKIPGGRRARGLPPLSPDPTIRKAQRLIEELMAKRLRVVEEGESEGGQAPDVQIAPPQEPPAGVTVPPERLDELEAAEDYSMIF
jgi:hypothetical protein